MCTTTEFKTYVIRILSQAQLQMIFFRIFLFIVDAGTLTMKMEPKTKRSYGKRKPVSVPELLAVRLEIPNEEAAKTKANPDEVLVEVVMPNAQLKSDPGSMENVEYDGAGVQEISVYEDVQEIDWIEQSQPPLHTNEKVRSGIMELDKDNFSRL